MNALEVARVAHRSRVPRTNPNDRPVDQCVFAALVTRRLAGGGCHAKATNDVEPDYFGLTSSFVRAQWFGVGSSIAARRAAILQRVPSSSRSAQTSSRELNGRFASSAAAIETSSRRRYKRL